MSSTEKKIKHKLDFDYPDFLTFKDLPPDGILPMRGYYLLCTVENHTGWMFRPVYHVHDTSGYRFMLAFYIEKELMKQVNNLAPGTVLCFNHPQKHWFADGSVGLRIEDEDMKNVFHIPFGIKALNELNDYLCKNENKCRECGQDDAQSKCVACKIPYCDRSCQKNDWRPSHRNQCKTIAYLRELNQVFY